MSFWSSLGQGLLSLLTGGISSYYGNLGRLLSAGGDSVNNADPAGTLDNYLAKQTGSRLTDAEREANAWTAEREDIAWERQMEASNTAYQRQVADMKAAGLNPAMMYGSGSSGASIPSAGAVGSVSPAGGSSINLGSLLQMAMEMKLLPAKIANLNADTAKKVADADSTETQTGYFKSVASIRAEAERLENEKKGSEIRAIDVSIRREKAQIAKTIEETKESQERQRLLVEQAILANVQANNIVYMQPFLKAESVSRAGLNNAQARVAAVDEAYRQGLIDEGAIAAAVRLDNAHASESEINTKTKQFAQALKDGSLRKAADEKGDWRSYVAVGLYEALNNASASILGKW